MKGFFFFFFFFLLFFLCFFAAGARACINNNAVRLTKPTGVLSSGASPYPNSVTCSWSITLESSNSVIFLSIDTLSTECGWDYVHVYDGPSEAYPKIAAYCGTRSGSDVVVSSSKSMYVVFVSDAGVAAAGFSLSYTSGSCPTNCTVPVAGGAVCSPQYCSCKKANGMQCSPVLPNEPPPRVGHTALYDPTQSQVVVFGGHSPDDVDLKDLRLFSFDSPDSWLRIHLNQSIPIPTFKHASTLAEGILYIHGGDTASGASNQFCSFDFLSGWTSLEPAGPKPPALFGHTLTYVPETRTIYLFGGFSEITRFSNRLYAYSLDTNSWSKVEPQRVIPPLIYGHVAAYHAPTRRIYFHGGVRDSGFGLYANRDVVAFHVILKSWEIASQTANVRMHHGAISAGNLLIAHGGLLPLDANGGSCFYDTILAYSFLCKTWTEVRPKGGAVSVQRTGHNIFLRGTSLYVVGGFDGNFYGGMVPISITLPFLQDYSCAATYCASLSSCNACTSVPICAWCSSLGTCVTSTAIEGEYGVSHPQCAGSSTCDPPVNDCFGRVSCGTCLAGNNCSWCETFSTCFPQDISEQTPCASRWNNDTCGDQLCGLMSSCDSCLSRSSGSLTCNWCPYTNTCISSSGSCPRSPITSIATCATPCSQYLTARSCYQSHTCMWCASQGLCFSNDVYLIAFTFGECHTWSQYETIKIFTTIELTFTGDQYTEFLFDIGDNTGTDIVVLVESTNPIEITLQSLLNQISWRNEAPLRVSSYDPYRAIGQYYLRASNINAKTQKIKLRVELQEPTGPDPNEPGFNVVYFVSFFFLFLFSFLFVAVILKKVRDIVVFNRLRAEYIRSRTMMVFPDKFVVNLKNSDESLRLLTPEAPAVPIAIEYIADEHTSVAAVTFVLLGPSNSDDLLPSLGFATTFSPLKKGFVFPPQKRYIPPSIEVSEETLEEPSETEELAANNRRPQSQETPEVSVMEQMEVEESRGVNIEDITSFPNDMVARLDRARGGNQ